RLASLPCTCARRTPALLLARIFSWMGVGRPSSRVTAPVFFAFRLGHSMKMPFSRCLTLVAVGSLLCLAARAAEQTALDRYVAWPDTNYSYKLANTVPGDGQTTFVLDMTSQAWLTTNEVNQPLWKHSLLIVKPDKVTTSKALLFISGGS